MRNYLRLLAAALLLGAVASCVELTGQRISLRYDAGKDELQILLCHDGIHESPPSRNEDGPKQIAEYVENGDILLLDWPGSIRKKDLRAAAERSSELPAFRDLCLAAAASIRSTPVGRYRDPDGRVGAAQWVVVSQAKEIVNKFNAMINEGILHEPVSTESIWALTVQRMQDGARQGRAWLAIDGHSLRFTFPAHPAEWSRNKAAFVKAIVDGWEEAKAGKSNDNRPAFFLQLLALSPLSLDESTEGVSIRLGHPQRPLSLRFALRDVYNTKLEATLATAVPTELDEALARHLIGGGETRAAQGVEAIAAWGPPEDSVRALLGRASGPDAAARGPALAQLRSLGEVWNRDGALPRAPERNDSRELYLEAWRQWYRTVITFPTGE